MEVQFELHVPGEVLEKTLGWPPSDGADVTMVGTGEAGLVEVLDVPEHLRDVAPEGLAALSFMTDDFGGAMEKASAFTNDVTMFDTGFPGFRTLLLHDGWRTRRVHGCLCSGSEFGHQRRDELLSAASRLAALARILSQRNHSNREIGDAGVAVAPQPARGQSIRHPPPWCPRRLRHRRARAVGRSWGRSRRGRAPRSRTHGRRRSRCFEQSATGTPATTRIPVRPAAAAASVMRGTT